ncbi:hypothetical protein M436DRAFT_86074 [Aureobasidium namibiae CBS 147.97]|uniref:Uncharacterized protein n=1 Tax=Aureobasidium namibiae CBS 147.97 TaxID=1043004 RepID=A0A074W760_9PEZI
MSNSAPLQKLLVWLRRQKEDSRSHSAGALGTEQNDRDFVMDPTTTDKPDWSQPQNTSLDRSVSKSTRRFSKISGRSWSTDKWSDDNASDLKRQSGSHRLSMFSSHNPDEDSKSLSPTISSSATRASSYVPRHASSSHLRTTAPLSPHGQAIKDRKAGQVY